MPVSAPVTPEPKLELMDWMAEKHEMNPLEGEFRDTIVDYLARHYGPRTRGPRGGNPFLN